jgi:hypothetical protein
MLDERFRQVAEVVGDELEEIDSVRLLSPDRL